MQCEIVQSGGVYQVSKIGKIICAVEMDGCWYVYKEYLCGEGERKREKKRKKNLRKVQPGTPVISKVTENRFSIGNAKEQHKISHLLTTNPTLYFYS